MEQYHGTTILGVKKDGRTVIAGDGQVSLGNTVIKPNAKKVRRLGGEGRGRRFSAVQPRTYSSAIRMVESAAARSASVARVTASP